MPNSKQHSDKASHNRAFLATIDVNEFSDWAAVVAFYAAVHLVERLRTREQNLTDQHSTDHQDRLAFVQKKHRAIHTAFHELFNASLIARYQTLERFRKQIPVQQVQNILIDTYLAAIEQHVAIEFSPPMPSAGS